MPLISRVVAARKNLSDEEIAQRVAAGDRDAFGVLMQRHNRMLFRTARSILKDDSEAEDAVQDAYLQAFRAMADFQGNARLSTWLVRIVVNEALGRLRKRRRGAQVIFLDSEAANEAEQGQAAMENSVSERPEVLAYRTQARRLIEQKIDALPDAYRTVFVLRAIEEMSVEEAAACLDIPEATVRTRFFRARGMLREMLAHEMDLATGEAFGFDGERCNRIVARVLARLDAARPGVP